MSAYLKELIDICKINSSNWDCDISLAIRQAKLMYADDWQLELECQLEHYIKNMI